MKLAHRRKVTITTLRAWGHPLQVPRLRTVISAIRFALANAASSPRRMIITTVIPIVMDIRTITHMGTATTMGIAMTTTIITTHILMPTIPWAPKAF